MYILEWGWWTSSMAGYFVMWNVKEPHISMTNLWTNQDHNILWDFTLYFVINLWLNCLAARPLIDDCFIYDWHCAKILNNMFWQWLYLCALKFTWLNFVQVQNPLKLTPKSLSLFWIEPPPPPFLHKGILAPTLTNKMLQKTNSLTSFVEGTFDGTFSAVKRLTG